MIVLCTYSLESYATLSTNDNDSSQNILLNQMTESKSSELPADVKVESPDSSQPFESFSYNDSIVRLFMLATLVWGVSAALVGLIVALLLVMPELSLSKFLSFGRLRPVLTNLAIFAFAGNAIFAAVYYSTQRLCKARMWSDTLSYLNFLGWQLINIAATITLPLGITQSKEFAELEWPIDIAIAIVWIGFFGINFFMTLARRRERYLYVSLWFYIAAIVAFSILHVVGNMVVPHGLFKSVSVYAGAEDAMVQWWHGHNMLAFFLGMPFLGLMYYFLPRASERPVFSYRLCIIQFWSLVIISVWAGPRYLHYTSIATWASSLGVVFSLMLWMPSWAGVVNGFSTLRGAWHKVVSDPVLKFFVAGLAFYGLATVEGSLLSIKSVDALAHYTDWTSANLHAGALGWIGFMTFGMMYWLLPQIFQTKLWSVRLASLHFWIGTLGLLLYLVAGHIAGIIQGSMWQALTADGYLAYPNFVETVTAIKPMWWACLVGGLLYASGIVMLAVNYFMTWRSRPNQYEAPVVQAAPLSKDFKDGAAVTKSRIDGVLNIGHKVDVWQQATWHRGWERRPMRFAMLTALVVIISSACELVPMLLIPANVPVIESVRPYTPLELAGRDIYIAEGCCNCHAQQIRPLFAETERYGQYSQAGEFVYDRPNLWGTRRIGPDLSREGGKQTGLWHLEHFRDPAAKVDGSVMPSYPHLLMTKLDFNSIQSRFNVDAQLSTAHDHEFVPTDQADQMAKQQARRIAWELAQLGGPITVDSSAGQQIRVDETQLIALIAYIQRLGTDLQAAEETVDNKEPLTDAQQVTWDKYSQMLTYDSILAADVSVGKRVYADTCGKCHRLFDEGGNIGPALTATNRWNRDYLLENIVAPSREILEAYQTEIVLTIDEIVVTGVIVSEDDENLVLMTADQKRVEIYQDDIEERKTSKLSLMPEGQLDTLTSDQVRSLFKYLQLPKPLAAAKSTEEPNQ